MKETGSSLVRFSWPTFYCPCVTMRKRLVAYCTCNSIKCNGKFIYFLLGLVLQPTGSFEEEGHPSGQETRFGGVFMPATAAAAACTAHASRAGICPIRSYEWCNLSSSRLLSCHALLKYFCGRSEIKMEIQTFCHHQVFKRLIPIADTNFMRNLTIVEKRSTYTPSSGAKRRSDM